jgi:hypothetical protein
LIGAENAQPSVGRRPSPRHEATWRSDKQRDPVIKAKLMKAFCKGAITLQKLQMEASQIVTVQYAQINGGQAIMSNVGQR